MDDVRPVGVGASAGGIEALFDLVPGLEPDLGATLLVVVHQAEGGPSVLTDLLARRSRVPVTTARHGERLEPGRVIVAPPDSHLHLVKGHVSLDRGPKEKGHRPGIDPLFRSLALDAGPRAVGVVLSGLLDDGAGGVLDIVRHGGTAVVQDPDDAQFDAMPHAALEQVPGAIVRRAAEIGTVLREVTHRRPLEARRTDR